MIKKLKNPKYWDKRVSGVKFAIFPVTKNLENGDKVRIWLEKYRDIYVYSIEFRTYTTTKYWRYEYSEIIKEVN